MTDVIGDLKRAGLRVQSACIRYDTLVEPLVELEMVGPGRRATVKGFLVGNVGDHGIEIARARITDHAEIWPDCKAYREGRL